MLPKYGRSSVFSYIACHHPTHYKTRQKCDKGSKQEICNVWATITVDGFGLKDRFSIIYGFYFKLNSKCHITLD
jgi:hypothetical protein